MLLSGAINKPAQGSCEQSAQLIARVRGGTLGGSDKVLGLALRRQHTGVALGGAPRGRGLGALGCQDGAWGGGKVSHRHLRGQPAVAWLQREIQEPTFVFSVLIYRFYVVAQFQAN